MLSAIIILALALAGSIGLVVLGPPHRHPLAPEADGAAVSDATKAKILAGLKDLAIAFAGGVVASLSTVGFGDVFIGGRFDVSAAEAIAISAFGGGVIAAVAVVIRWFNPDYDEYGIGAPGAGR